MDHPIPDSAFWGKLERTPSGDVVRWHPLVDHCIDVASALRALLALPAILRSLHACTTAKLTEVDLDRLAVFGLLHDLGKCNTGFQAKRGNGGPLAGHVREVAGLFLSSRRPPAWDQALDEMAAWFADGLEAVEALLFCSISHHGRPVSRNDLGAISGDPARWWLPRGSLDPMTGVMALANTARATFPAAFASGTRMVATPALQHRFAGLLMLADWLASDVTYFPYRTSNDEDRVGFARVAAARALRSIGLLAEPYQRDIDTRSPSFFEVFGRKPYPLQQFLAEELTIDDDARVVLIESETGSGKTEAALSWFLRLLRLRRVDGLYFALPTRVAARELYGRVRSAIAGAFPDPVTRPNPVLLAVPGYAKASASTLPSPEGRIWADDSRDALRDRLWASEHPKRFLAAPVAVGTIDQALLSSLQVRHAHLRSACLDRHLLVVDEVHASDPYMREILAHLLHGHCARGGHALLLSATLGESARTHLLRTAEAPLEEARARAYPLVNTLSGRYPIASLEARAKRVRLETSENLESPDLLVPAIADALAGGARVLVVLNTVKRANALLRAVEASERIQIAQVFRVFDVPCPHHGRYARADRELLDAAISARLGPGSGAGPLLVIGTQTLEQSLDIDADWLITDACPMDVLLQRLGRLHRHAGRARPSGHREPRALVLNPTAGDFARFVDGRGQARGPGGIGSVYADARILQRTADLVRERREIVIPRDNRPLVEDATHRESLETLVSPAWERHARYLEGVLLAELRQAEIGALEEVPFGECQFRADDGPIVTRLGANDQRVRLPTPVRSPFGATIDEVLIPGHMLRGAMEGEASGLTLEPEGFFFHLGERSFRYSRFGLEPIDA